VIIENSTIWKYMILVNFWSVRQWCGLRVWFMTIPTLDYAYCFFKANSAFHPSGVSKWVPVRLGRQRQVWLIPLADERGVRIKLWYPLRTRAIPERLRGVFTTRRYTNLRLPHLTFSRHRQTSLASLINIAIV